jgi:DinB superfamily
MIRLIVVVSLLLGSAWGQEANPVSTAARKQIMKRAHNLLSAAKEMPGEKYDFKATDKQMTFGHLVWHTARANYALCSLITGEKSAFPQELKDTDPKDKLVPVLEQSVNYCDGVLAKTNDKALGEVGHAPWGEDITKAEALLEINADQADHFSLAATYLRLNGLLPPTAKK